MENSKPIEKSDDSSKEFILQSLQGDKTYGMDIDSIYLLRDNSTNQYFIFEYLKCENQHVTPHKSEPKYYPFNWRKFHFLFQLSKQLNAKLILVNYSDGYMWDKDTKSKVELPNKQQYLNEVRVLTVSSINYNLLRQYEKESNKPKHLDYIQYEDDKQLTRSQFSEYLRDLNKKCNTNIDLEKF